MYTVECLAIRGDARDRRSVLLVSTNANRDSHLSELMFYEEEAGPATPLFAEDIWCTDMWKTPDNRHFLCDVSGTCHWQQPDGTFVSSSVTDKTLYAIWGLDDRAVFTLGDGGDGGTCRRFDGRSWLDMSKGLDGRFHAISGTADDDLYAAGDGGALAHWDGQAWRRLELPATVDWRAIDVRAPGHLDLCGLGGAFLRYAEGKVVFSTQAPSSLLALARFRGETYVGSPTDGVFRLEGEELVLFKDKAKAAAMSATDGRLFACAGSKGAWFDGETWRAVTYSKP